MMYFLLRITYYICDLGNCEGYFFTGKKHQTSIKIKLLHQAITSPYRQKLYHRIPNSREKGKSIYY